MKRLLLVAVPTALLLLSATARAESVRGDFNGDGCADLAVGVPGDLVRSRGPARAVRAGAVNVIYGSATGLTAVGNQIWTQNSPGILGIARANDRFGSALAAGDFNGDGFADLAIGVRGERVAGAANAGAVNVIYGSATGLTAAGNQLLTQATASLAGANYALPGSPAPPSEVPEVGDQFGSALAAGDNNGDTYDDLLVGAPGENGNKGYFAVVFGSASGLVETAGGAQANPLEAAEYLGSRAGSVLAMADLGAVDGDYLVLGIPAVNAVQIFRTPWQSAKGIGIPGSGSGDGRLGYSLAVGDFDGDGDNDLAMGAPGHSPGGAVNGGGLLVCYGPYASLEGTCPDVALPALSSGDRFGAAVAAGDVNGDGFDDLAVGAPDDGVKGAMRAGSVFVIHGSASGLAGPFQKWHQRLRAVPDNAEPLDRFGASLAIHDFDHDGFDELAVGVPGETVNDRIVRAPRVGMVEVFPGTAGGLTAAGVGRWHQNRAGILGTARGADAFGASLAQ